MITALVSIPGNRITEPEKMNISQALDINFPITVLKIILSDVTFLQL